MLTLPSNYSEKVAIALAKNRTTSVATGGYMRVHSITYSMYYPLVLEARVNSTSSRNWRSSMDRVEDRVKDGVIDPRYAPLLGRKLRFRTAKTRERQKPENVDERRKLNSEY